MEQKIVTHPDPVWRDRSNFIIRAQTEVGGNPESFRQLERDLQAWKSAGNLMIENGN